MTLTFIGAFLVAALAAPLAHLTLIAGVLVIGGIIHDVRRVRLIGTICSPFLVVGVFAYAIVVIAAAFVFASGSVSTLLWADVSRLNCFVLLVFVAILGLSWVFALRHLYGEMGWKLGVPLTWSALSRVAVAPFLRKFDGSEQRLDIVAHLMSRMILALSVVSAVIVTGRWLYR